nr:hypothetical protein [Tanacetum cinerariifolium]
MMRNLVPQRIAREKATEQEAKDAALIEQMEDVQERIDTDALLEERLQQEEREQFTVDEQAKMLVDLIAERKKFFAAQRAEQIKNKTPTKAQLRNKMVTYLKNMDAKIAQRLFKEEQAQFKREQRIAREKATEQEAKDAALIEQMEDVQARIDTDALLEERLQQEEREQFTVDEQAKMLV